MCDQFQRKQGIFYRSLINNTEFSTVQSHSGIFRSSNRFHHHFREGDYVVNMVMKEIHDMGIKDITICASSLGKAHDPLVEYIEDGTITNIQSSGVRGKIGEAISNGKLKGLAIMRSHVYVPW